MVRVRAKDDLCAIPPIGIKGRTVAMLAGFKRTSGFSVNWFFTSAPRVDTLQSVRIPV